jgi:hypothetical protein
MKTYLAEVESIYSTSMLNACYYVLTYVIAVRVCSSSEYELNASINNSTGRYVVKILQQI